MRDKKTIKEEIEGLVLEGNFYWHMKDSID